MIGAAWVLAATIILPHACEARFGRDIIAFPVTSAYPGSCVVLVGRKLGGARVYMREEYGDTWVRIPTCAMSKPTAALLERIPVPFCYGLSLNEAEALGARLPRDAKLACVRVFLKVRRGGLFRFIGPLLPERVCPGPVRVLDPFEPPGPEATDDRTHRPLRTTSHEPELSSPRTP